jgi:hypothetical protein
MVKGESKIYNGSYSLGLIRYSKKEGIGYLSPFGSEEEGSVGFFSTEERLPDNGKVGLPRLKV